MGKMSLAFIDSHLLYRGALKGRFDCTIFSIVHICGSLSCQAEVLCLFPQNCAYPCPQEIEITDL
jgi:hypothetical protein